MSSHYELRDLPAQPAVFGRETLPQDKVTETLSRLLPAVGKQIAAQGGTFVGPPFTRWLAWGETDCTVEAGIAVAAPLADTGEFYNGTLGGVLAAFTVHTGSYDTLQETYLALEAWALTQGKQSNGPRWEVYMTDPTTLPPSKWRTELYLPVTS